MTTPAPPAAEPTPRVDAVDSLLLRFKSGEHPGLEVISATNHGYLVECARQLERELTAERAKADQLQTWHSELAEECKVLRQRRDRETERATAAEARAAELERARDEFASELEGSFTERVMLGEYGERGWGYRCQHCERELDILHWTTAEHEPDCIVLKARAALRRPDV